MNGSHELEEDSGAIGNDAEAVQTCTVDEASESGTSGVVEGADTVVGGASERMSSCSYSRR